MRVPFWVWGLGFLQGIYEGSVRVLLFIRVPFLGLGFRVFLKGSIRDLEGILI